MDALSSAAAQLKFRDVNRASALLAKLQSLTVAGPEVSVMHVCGSHEQAIARFGLRSALPAHLNVLMGPGCPVCVTDVPEVDEAVTLALDGIAVCTYGDMLKVPGTAMSLADARAEGAPVTTVYSVDDAVALASRSSKEVVFFATGFETTAVATAAAILKTPPSNFSVLSAHKYIPPVMEIVAEMPQSRVQGYLAAGHAATITGARVFESFARTHGVPVVVAGFEPLDILAALVRLMELVREQRAEVVNMFPRCVSDDGNRVAQTLLWDVFQSIGGRWRGIAQVPNGNLRLKERWAHLDARKRFSINRSRLTGLTPPKLLGQCLCGEIMAGIRRPSDCALFGKACTPENPVGACMVSSEGTCRIWQQYGGAPRRGGTT